MQRLTAACLAAALGLGSVAGSAAAEERAPVEVVRELLPKLRSDDPGEREEAKRQIMALGADGRAALENVARGSDPGAAARALELLSDPRWRRVGEEAVEPVVPGRTGDRVRDPLARIRKLLETRLHGTRELEEWHRKVVENLPERIEVDLKRLFEEGQLSAGTMGRVEENGRLFAWKEDRKGGIRVRVRDGKDAEEVIYEASSLDELRRKAPDVAKRLDAVRSKHGKGGFTLRLRPHDLRVELGPGLRELRLDEERIRSTLDRVRASLPETRELFRHLRERLNTGSRPDLRAAHKPRLGIEWTPPPPALRAHLGLESGGMLVRKVTEGSPAARLGMRKHDVLVRVAGRRVATSADVRIALDTVEEGAKLTAVVVRAGKRVELSTVR